MRSVPPQRPEETPFEELKRYVRFGDLDEGALASMQGPAEEHLDELLDLFDDTIDDHPGARAVFTDPDVQRPRLRKTLVGWIRTLLRGPYDESYARRRAAIGRAHVKHHMPQRYMLTAMNLVRTWFVDLAFETFGDDPERARAVVAATGRLLDIELSMMLGTYRDDLLGRMQQQERLATIGELSAGIHHELENPLAAISASAFALGERRSLRADPRARELLNRVSANVEKSSQIISDLLSFTRLKTPVAQPVALEAAVDAAISRVVIPATCRITVDLDPELARPIVDGAQLEQVLVNLLQNAFDACETGGQVRVVGRSAGGHVELAVVDDGVGVEPVDLLRVFEPLYSTKPEGVGLGLPLSRHLIQANSGEIRMKSTLGGGTTVTITLPF